MSCREFHLYIIYSKTIDRYYVGETEDLSKRLILHLKHTFKGSYTTQAKDWEIVFNMRFNTRDSARRAERIGKSKKSRKFIENLIKHPELQLKLRSLSRSR